MLVIKLPSIEFFDDDSQEFITSEGATLHLEHSLISLSKWESKFEKPFLSQTTKTNEEVLEYIKCMTLNEEIDDIVYRSLTPENFQQINEYINAKMTATTFKELPGQPRRSSQMIVTSELIYYWMVALTIPFSCETWHLERLLTLIKVCNEKNKPPKKMSRREAAAQQRALNAQRRQQYGHSG